MLATSSELSVYSSICPSLFYHLRHVNNSLAGRTCSKYCEWMPVQCTGVGTSTTYRCIDLYWLPCKVIGIQVHCVMFLFVHIITGRYTCTSSTVSDDDQLLFSVAHFYELWADMDETTVTCFNLLQVVCVVICRQCCWVFCDHRITATGYTREMNHCCICSCSPILATYSGVIASVVYLCDSSLTMQQYA